MDCKFIRWYKRVLFTMLNRRLNMQRYTQLKLDNIVNTEAWLESNSAGYDLWKKLLREPYVFNKEQSEVLLNSIVNAWKPFQNYCHQYCKSSDNSIYEIWFDIDFCNVKKKHRHGLDEYDVAAGIHKIADDQGINSIYTSCILETYPDRKVLSLKITGDSDYKSEYCYLAKTDPNPILIRPVLGDYNDLFIQILNYKIFPERIE